ncbi:MAG: NAD(P)H-hydrate epimerase [Candidatus Omnitrophota bacterium]|jgi:NAD(P)H-hydrate epimerase
MTTITPRQAKRIDLKAAQQLGISTLVMMENAGIRIADFVLEIFKKKSNKDIAVFCGKGNNAGDGLVVSRQLLCQGIDVDTFLIKAGGSLSPVAGENLKILKRLTKKIRQIKTKKDLEAINLSSYSILIDAIFGIGLKGRVEGIIKEVIQRMNSSKRTIVSIDIPSGLDANRGSVLGIAIKANYTLTLIAPKRGLLINQGPRFTGKLIVKHIGFPW